MLPTDDEIEVDTCGDKACHGFFKAWNVIAIVWWGGLFAGFYLFRRPQMLNADCPLPWDVFFLGDTLLQVLYYATALVGQCCIDSDGDTRKPGQLLQKFRMACCLPLSFCWYLVGIIFGGVNWVCFEYEANPPRLWFFQYTFLGYMVIRGCQQCTTFLILCLQCCALNTFRKQEITAEISKVDIQHQAIAASEQVQRWAVIVGIQQVGIDTLVGYGAAEEYRRRKRDLEEGFKKYQLKKKKKRNIQVTHVKTKAEVEEEKAAARMANHQPVFPFMRMTNIVRQQDVKLDDPFHQLGKNGSTDLVAANKAAHVVAIAAARVAKRSGAHMVGVPARRNL